MLTTPPSNHPESDALWQPEPLAKPSPHYTYTFADNYREDEYKFACGMEERCRQAVSDLKSSKCDLELLTQNNISLKAELESFKGQWPTGDYYELTLERESLKEQLERLNEQLLNHSKMIGEHVRNPPSVIDGIGMLVDQIRGLKSTNQSLITQRNLDTECIERLQRKGVENEVKIEEQVAQMAVMVRALKYGQRIYRKTHANNVSELELLITPFDDALTNIPLAAKDLLERMERMTNALQEIVEMNAPGLDGSPAEPGYHIALKALSTIKQSTKG